MRRTPFATVMTCAVLLSATCPTTADVQYTKFTEPNEKAFTALVPAGWQTEGGIVRWGPNVAGAMNYVPELTWILFLRILDERETQEAEEWVN